MQDATGKTAREIHEMGAMDRELTALVRARYYKERGDAAESAQQGGGL